MVVVDGFGPFFDKTNLNLNLEERVSCGSKRFQQFRHQK